MGEIGHITQLGIALECYVYMDLQFAMLQDFDNKLHTHSDFLNKIDHGDPVDNHEFF